MTTHRLTAAALRDAELIRLQAATWGQEQRMDWQEADPDGQKVTLRLLHGLTMRRNARAAELAK